MKICESRPKTVNSGASLIKLRMNIAAFTHFVMPYSSTNCQNCARTMKYCHLFCTNTLNEIKLERNSREANVSLGMIHSIASKLIPCLSPNVEDFHNQVFSLNLNISAKYEHNWTSCGSKSVKVAHSG